MKQQITVKQYNELDQESKWKYNAWVSTQVNINKEWHSVVVEEPYLLTIGQMIEILEEHCENTFSIYRRIVDWKVVSEKKFYAKDLELCDALWEAVTQILQP